MPGPPAPSVPSMLLALLTAVAGPGAALARDPPVFELQDPTGDDHGSGVLIYPNRDDFEPGDLDLVSFAATRDEGGTWFAVAMAQPVRDPAGRVTEIGQTPLESIARHGFYTFNVDVYVDVDRVAGSGATVSVPGRGVTIDRRYAWEKCIVLTPRPDIARTMLQLAFDAEFEAELQAQKGRVTKQDLDDLEARSEQRVEDRYLFPTRIRVNGRRVEFFVPDAFLGGAPSRSWGYTVLVTGADLEQTSRPGQLTPVRPAMLTMPVARGMRPSQFGIRGDADVATPPVVDLLAVDENTQATVLSDYDAVAGRLAAVPGEAPDGTVSVTASGLPATAEQGAAIGGAAAAPSPVPGTGSPAAPAERRTVPARLRTLNELLEQGLITQDEYNTLRRKILAEL